MYIRPLGALERYYVNKNLSLKRAVRVSGTIDAEIAGDAFVELLRVHPILAAVVARVDGDPVLAHRSNPAAHVSIREGDVEEYLDAGAESLDTGEAICRLDIVSCGDDHAVALTVAHFAADARACIKYLREFWSIYTDLHHNGRSRCERAVQEIPAPPEKWLRIEDAPEFKKLEEDFVNPASPMTGEASIRRLLRFKLDTTETAALVTEMRRQDRSVHCALAGAVLTAERALIPEQGELPMLLRSSVDVRNRLSPQLETFDVTAILGQSIVGVRVGEKDGVLDVGDQVMKDIHEGIADRSIIYSSVAETTGFRPQCSYLVNIGKVEGFESPKNLTMVDFRPANSAGTAYRAATYRAYCFQGELTVDVFAPAKGITPDLQQSLQDDVRRRLVGAAAV
ncbi:hypothetical protein GCM10027289_18400 [Tsukamurella serpentis]